MTRKEALVWAIKYISIKARKSHVDYDEYVRRTKYIVNRIYDEFEEISLLEQRIAELEVQLADANSYFDGIRTELLANKIKES